MKPEVKKLIKKNMSAKNLKKVLDEIATGDCAIEVEEMNKRMPDKSWYYSLKIKVEGKLMLVIDRRMYDDRPDPWFDTNETGICAYYRVRKNWYSVELGEDRRRFNWLVAMKAVRRVLNENQAKVPEWVWDVWNKFERGEVYNVYGEFHRSKNEEEMIAWYKEAIKRSKGRRERDVAWLGYNTHVNCYVADYDSVQLGGDCMPIGQLVEMLFDKSIMGYDLLFAGGEIHMRRNLNNESNISPELVEAADAWVKENEAESAWAVERAREREIS